MLDDSGEVVWTTLMGVMEIYNCRGQLIEMRNQFIELRQKYNSELASMPKGSLSHTRRGEQCFYYKRERIKGELVRRGITKDQGMVRLLARKRFLELAVREIDANIRVLDRAVREFRDCDPKDIIAGMTAAYKTLSTDCFFNKFPAGAGIGKTGVGKFSATGKSGIGAAKVVKNKIGDLTATELHGLDEELHGPDGELYDPDGELYDPDGELYDPEEELFMSEEELAQARYKRHAVWANADYERSTYMPERLVEITSRGERVRTKSEVLIAETLYKYNVPFRYEDMSDYVWLGVIPDFTFRDRNKRLFYLEYCGMMDNEEYVRNFLYKRNKYEDNGIYEWKNIIYVFEKNNQINMSMIDSIVQNQIIPRL